MKYSEVRILIIDDEKALLKMLVQRLSRIGITLVDVAETAEEGIKKINSNQYHLILTDIKMPGMSGHDLCDHVKYNLDQPIPVIAMSGTSWLAEKSAFDAVLTKPFNKEELLSVISQFVHSLTII